MAAQSSGIRGVGATMVATVGVGAGCELAVGGGGVFVSGATVQPLRLTTVISPMATVPTRTRTLPCSRFMLRIYGFPKFCGVTIAHHRIGIYRFSHADRPQPVAPHADGGAAGCSNSFTGAPLLRPAAGFAAHADEYGREADQCSFDALVSVCVGIPGGWPKCGAMTWGQGES